MLRRLQVTDSTQIWGESKGSGQIDHATVDLEVDFVQMPSRVGPGSALAQVGRNPGPEMDRPTANGLVRNRDVALRQQIPDVAEAERESEIKPSIPLNDLGQGQITRIADFIYQIG